MFVSENVVYWRSRTNETVLWEIKRKYVERRMFGTDRWRKLIIQDRSCEKSICKYHSYEELEYLYNSDNREIIIREKYFNEFLFRNIVYDILREMHIWCLFEFVETALENRIWR